MPISGSNIARVDYTRAMFFILLYGLALATITRWVATERGPYGLLERPRKLFTQRWDERGRPLGPSGFVEELGAMLSCWVCNAPWLALLLVPLHWVPLLYPLPTIDSGRLSFEVRTAAFALGDAIAMFLAVVQVSYLANRGVES